MNSLHNPIIKKIIIGTIAILSAFICFIYFYRVTDDYYLADIAPHVEGAKMVFKSFAIYSITPNRTILVSYPIFHICTKMVSYLVGGNFTLSASLVLSFFSILTWLLIIYIIRDIYRQTSTGSYSIIEYCSIGLIFMTALPLTGKFYLPQGSPTVWHNPTYITMKPFALLTFYYIYKVIGKDIFNKKDIIILSVLSVLSCLAKPSSSIVIIPAVFIYVALDTFEHKEVAIKKIVTVCGVFAPTIGLLAIQFLQTFGESSGTGIRFGTFLELNLVESIIATLAVIIFPLFYSISVKFKYNNKAIMKLAICCFVVGWIQYYFLYEIEYAHGNYAWGYFIGIFLLYFATYVDFSCKAKKNFAILIYVIQSGIGLYYLYELLKLHSYLI